MFICTGSAPTRRRAVRLDLGRGKAQFHRALEFLTRVDEFNGAPTVDLTRALRRFGGAVRRRGLVLLISDLLDSDRRIFRGDRIPALSRI